MTRISPIPSSRRSRFLQCLLTAAIKRDATAIAQAASDAGYLQPDDSQSYREAVTALLLDAAEPARYQGEYDFANSKLAGRMSEKVMAMASRRATGACHPQTCCFCTESSAACTCFAPGYGHRFMSGV